MTRAADYVLPSGRTYHADDPSPIGSYSTSGKYLDGTSWERWTSENGRAWRILERRSDGAPQTDFYYFDRRFSRLDGPAQTKFDDSGKVQSQEWQRDGLLHRIDGPGFIGRNSNYTIETWWFGGSILDHHRELGASLERLTDERIAAELRWSRFSPLLDEGFEPRAIASALASGAYTEDGLRSVLDGAPTEWVIAFEAGAR